jgi:arylsulfatase A-like enzyme
VPTVGRGGHAAHMEFGRPARATHEQGPARFTRARWAATTLLALGALAAAEASVSSSPPATEPLAQGVILISIDTLRADHLGYAGYPAPVSPAIDRFRSDAVAFSTDISQATSTLASHASMLTSTLVPHHGASFSKGTGLSPRAVTLGEVLQQGGVATASFNEAGQLSPEFGLGRGFDKYEATWLRHDRCRLSVEVKHAETWLRRHDDQPFFVFLHTYEVHHPYVPDPRYLSAVERSHYTGPLPALFTSIDELDRINRGLQPTNQADIAHIIATYDGQIRSMDDGFDELISFLKKRGTYDTTAIIFTSDHGEEFGEHGKVGTHSHTVFDELVRVPLLIKLPRNEHAGASIRQQVRSIDIAPTVAHFLGVASSPHFQGRDLLPLIAGAKDRARFAVSHLDSGDVSSVRTTRWKLVGSRLFDLTIDPGESRDVSDHYPEIAAYLQAQRVALVGLAPILTGPTVILPVAEQPALAALGYVNLGPHPGNRSIRHP